MSEINSNAKLPGMKNIEQINRVEGFDPAPFAVEYIDLNSGEKRKRLPVMIQMAWFRMKYPQGKIAVSVTPGNECFIANARVYPNYQDPESNYLAEATASRGYLSDKPSVSPREWAQTAAVGIALRNAGFGLQFSMAGEEFEETAADEFGHPASDGTGAAERKIREVPISEPVKAELTLEQRLDNAKRTPCPVAKYSGKTLGDMMMTDPNFLVWLAKKYKGSEEVSAAAQLLCDYAADMSA